MSVIKQLESYIKTLERQESQMLEKAADEENDLFMKGAYTGWADAFAVVKAALGEIVLESGENDLRAKSFTKVCKLRSEGYSIFEFLERTGLEIGCIKKLLEPITAGGVSG